MDVQCLSRYDRRAKAGKMAKKGRSGMNISRRVVLKGAAVLPLAVSNFGFGAAAQTATPAGDIPPILFVHGNGDHAALWMTTLWRMESNGISRDRMFAINFTDPLARTDDTV